MKELLTDKFAAVEDTCQDFLDAENECDPNTAGACALLYGPGASDCPMACNWNGSKNICAQNGDELLTDKFAAVEDTCQDFLDAENECDPNTAGACALLYGPGASDCPMACNWNGSKNICAQNGDELDSTTI
eukprot:scaffold5928_cov115-Skeletonema_dohrnii-CCMP3373.AAC.1